MRSRLGSRVGAPVEAVDDLTVPHQSELLAGEAFERSVRTQTKDPLAKRIVLEEQPEGLLSERAAFGAQPAEMDEAAAAEQARTEQGDE